jgi:hypothetical protein
MDKVHVGGLPGTQGKVKKGGEQRWRHKWKQSIRTPHKYNLYYSNNVTSTLLLCTYQTHLPDSSPMSHPSHPTYTWNPFFHFKLLPFNRIERF